MRNHSDKIFRADAAESRLKALFSAVLRKMSGAVKKRAVEAMG